jgi:hypothetical protein
LDAAGRVRRLTQGRRPGERLLECVKAGTGELVLVPPLQAPRFTVFREHSVRSRDE